MNKNYLTDNDERLNPDDARGKQDDETEEEYQDRLNDWDDMLDILND